ncbi:acrosin [Vombatus ursinus]|uniref:acrosin n=1 Tax=Vombatus ursinus TaxID=29139 RepID=UPI000FFD9B0F|nr:acrosin [Vombatus ursinus]
MHKWGTLVGEHMRRNVGDTGPCGLRPWANIEDVNSRILGGKDTRLGAWPWMVSMQLVTHNGQRDLSQWHLVVGVREVQRAGASIPGPFAQERRAVHILLHEQYNSWNENNDIALVEMNEPVYCGYMVQTACLPRPSDAPVRDSEPCIIAGWGYKEENALQPAAILQEAEVKIISLETCNGTEWYHGFIHSSNLCAGYPEGKIDTCQGDSGGPLMCKDKNSDTFVVTGITSWGTGCGRVKRPGVYTSTGSFLEWIVSKIGGDPTLNTPPPIENSILKPRRGRLGRGVAPKSRTSFIRAKQDIPKGKWGPFLL